MHIQLPQKCPLDLTGTELCNHWVEFNLLKELTQLLM